MRDYELWRNFRTAFEPQMDAAAIALRDRDQRAGRERRQQNRG